MSALQNWNPDAYREELRQKLYGQPGQGAFGAGQGPQAPPSQDTGMAPNGGAIQPPMPQMQSAQAQSAPVQTPAAAPQQSERKKIPIYPGGVQPKYTAEAAQSIKTPQDMVKKMSNADEFISAWEQERGSVNDHYDSMVRELGQRPDNSKLSKKDKFAMLMEFGLNLIKASQRGSGQSLAGALATSAGATFAGQRAKEMDAQDRYDARRSAIEQGRAGALKGLGTRSDALKTAFTVDREQAAAEKDRGYGDEVVGVEDTTSGLSGRTRGGALRLLMDPATGKQAQRDPKASGSRASSTYEQEHANLTEMYKRQGFSEAESRDKATRKMREGRNSTGRGFRKVARDEAKQVLSGSDDWKYASPADREKMLKDYIEQERRAAINDAYGIDLSEPGPYRSLGAIVGLGGERRASKSAENDLRDNPELATEFYEYYGYLPDDFWPE